MQFGGGSRAVRRCVPCGSAVRSFECSESLWVTRTDQGFMRSSTSMQRPYTPSHPQAPKNLPAQAPVLILSTPAPAWIRPPLSATTYMASWEPSTEPPRSRPRSGMPPPSCTAAPGVAVSSDEATPTRWMGHCSPHHTTVGCVSSPAVCAVLDEMQYGRRRRAAHWRRTCGLAASSVQFHSPLIHLIL